MASIQSSVTKIQVQKSDEAAVVVEKIIDAASDEVLLVVPRFSRLAESQANFHLIAREAGLLKRHIVIESVDDTVLAMAGAEGLEAINSILFRPAKRVSDIVAGGEKRGAWRPSARRKIKESIARDDKASFPKEAVLPRKDKNAGRWRKPRASWWFAGIAAALLLTAGGFLVLRALPRLAISLVSKKAAWEYHGTFVVEKKAGTAQVFSAERTLTLTFPSSGVKEVSRYARGVLVVYNAYSSEPQPLVAQTRFQTADGKIFRLAKSVVVPAAKITEGKIQPSSIETEVVADKPGAEYNAGPTPYLSVPGFRNTPKYQGFYGEIRASFSGGFVGTVAVPTEGDIRKAKTEVKEKLENAMIAALQTEIPKEFKLIDGARTFRLLQEGVTEEADASGNFGVTSRGSMHMVAFREATVNNAMEAKMKKEFGENYLFSESTVGYREARADFTAGSLAVTLYF